MNTIYNSKIFNENNKNNLTDNFLIDNDYTNNNIQNDKNNKNIITDKILIDNNTSENIQNDNNKNNLTDIIQNDNKIIINYKNKNNLTNIIQIADNKTDNLNMKIFKRKKTKRPKNKKIILDINKNINELNSDLKLINIKKNNKINYSFDNKINNNILNEEKEEKTNNDKSEKKDNLNIYIGNIIKKIKIKDRIKFLSESEIENLSYKDALVIDKRNKTDYYFSMLKEKNKIISIFLNDKDYNINSVKITLFLFNFNLSLTVNALFYVDEAIHEINKNQGAYDLSTEIVRILLSVAIGVIIELLALTHSDIIKLRYFNDVSLAEKAVPALIKKLKLKYVLYYLLNIFFNIIFFYYITAFCAIYSIIQTHMISDSLMSVFLAISYSIIFSMISTIIRIYSLKKENKVRHFIYLVSWVISLI